ncbi:MAG: hypothetical protein KDI46_09215 [Alphaproteobacteria bacterium]|nr:hypothetical protein [Alphaproteobacteria bacterium]
MSKSKKSEQVVVILTPEELRAVEDYRFGERIASRSEALRRLIRAGLKTLKNK